MYVRVVKRFIDIVLSGLLLLVLALPLLLLSCLIFMDDPGPVLFTQRRVGRGKRIFLLHKFRSMKMSTPHDVPTHMLTHPERYITRIGAFLRKSSLDELPQLYDIFIGRMSLVGPRPALFNQDDLVAERDKYGANDLMPGLTGWAQINGRDELEIPEKARLDGVYAEKMRQGGLGAFFFDCRCFFCTFSSVMRGRGVREGGTGAMREEKKG